MSNGFVSTVGAGAFAAALGSVYAPAGGAAGMMSEADMMKIGEMTKKEVAGDGTESRREHC